MYLILHPLQECSFEPVIRSQVRTFNIVPVRPSTLSSFVFRLPAGSGPICASPYLSRIAICVAGSVSPSLRLCVRACVGHRLWGPIRNCHVGVTVSGDQSESATWQLRPIRICHVATSSNQNLPRGNFVQSETATWQLRPIGNCHVGTSSNQKLPRGKKFATWQNFPILPRGNFFATWLFLIGRSCHVAVSDWTKLPLGRF